MPQDKLTKFKEVLKAVTEALTREEFVSAFKAVMEYVKKIDTRNVEDFKALRTALDKLSKEVKDSADLTLEDVKLEVSNQLQGLLKKVEATLAEVEDGEKGEKGDKGDKGERGDAGPRGPRGESVDEAKVISTLKERLLKK